MTLWCKVLIFLYFLTPCRSKVIIILWYVDPLQKQGHIGFGTWPLAEARSWPFFDFWLPAEAKSQLFFVMVILCRSKVTFVLALDPMQKQGLGHPLFLCRVRKDSKSYPHFTFQLVLEKCLKVVSPHLTFLFVWKRTQSRIYTLIFCSCAKRLKVISTSPV